MAAIEIKVPDIGDFKDVPVIEILVKPGDTVKKEDSLVTLESDKATMEVPSTHSGTVKEVRVKLGDKVSQGTVIATVEAGEAAKPAAPAAAPAPAPAQAAPSPQPASKGGGSARPSSPRSRASMPTTTPKCWCSAPARADTPPPSAPPTWACASRSSSATSGSAACA